MSLGRGIKDLKVLNEEKDEDDSDSESNLVPLFTEDEKSEGNDCHAGSVNVLHFQNSAEITLYNFRKEWKSELDFRLKESSTISMETRNRKEQSLHDATTKLFLEGVDYERRGDMWEAVQRYMGAVRMVPDIESKLYKDRSSSNSIGSSGRQRSRSRSHYGLHDLEKVLHKRLVDSGRFFEPEFPDEPCPIALLPVELLSILIRYVVGSELDVYCLELLSMTSAGFYLLARDRELWHAICRLTFGPKYVNSVSYTTSLSWRQMYITYPHPYLHGPWHIVIYYRMLRFFADGTVIMVVTSEVPAQVVGLLKSKTPRLAGVLFGHYWMVNQDRIAAQFHRHNEKSLQRTRRIHKSLHPFLPYEILDQKFEMELRFGDGMKRRAHCVLQIFEYNCTVTYLDGKVSYSCLDTTDHQACPPLFFSRVRSYAVPDGCDEILV
uniref:F-box protein Hrt3/FBXO9 C-terminal domain-containing protein n=1 Tax=Wuchereria bancrofti TaxID=6293 RepID=A0AAF5RTZ2_WUCBA